MRRSFSATCVVFSLFMLAPVAAAAHAEFDGTFDEVLVSGDGCQSVFNVTDYHTKHFLTGPTRRTSVLNFTDAASAGFFNGISFIGLYGGSGDPFYDKDITKDGWTYSVHAEGLLDRNVTVIEFDVTGFGPDDATCTASATYSGFN